MLTEYEKKIENENGNRIKKKIFFNLQWEINNNATAVVNNRRIRRKYEENTRTYYMMTFCKYVHMYCRVYVLGKLI